jgi:hypothetical protein
MPSSLRPRAEPRPASRPLELVGNKTMMMFGVSPETITGAAQIVKEGP